MTFLENGETVNKIIAAISSGERGAAFDIAAGDSLFLSYAARMDGDGGIDEDSAKLLI